MMEAHNNQTVNTNCPTADESNPDDELLEFHENDNDNYNDMV
jgi:hypothetical protein